MANRYVVVGVNESGAISLGIGTPSSRDYLPNISRDDALMVIAALRYALNEAKPGEDRLILPVSITSYIDKEV